MVQEKLKKIYICFDKHHTRLLSFIIAFYCSTVIIGKNTKNSKRYAFLRNSYRKVFGKKSWRSYSFGILTLLTSQPLDFYSKLTDGLVVNARYPNGGIQLKYFFVYSKKLFCHGYLNFVFSRNQLSEEKIAKRTKNHHNSFMMEAVIIQKPVQ